MIRTSSDSTGSSRVVLSKTRETSAALSAFLAAEPAKMTSVDALPLRLRTDCSPSTHLIASTTFDFPEPFGPTTTVMPSGNSNLVRSAKLLNPKSSRAFSVIMYRISTELYQTEKASIYLAHLCYPHPHFDRPFLLYLDSYSQLLLER